MPAYSRTFARMLAVALVSSSSACKSDHAAPNTEAAPETSPQEGSAANPRATPAMALTAEFLREHTRLLAADEMSGRAPGTEGAARAVEHIISVMKGIGLEPAGDGGGFTQSVPMRGVSTLADKTRLALDRRGKSVPLAFGKDIVASTFGPAGEHQISAPLVFMGYGVSAPDQRWDDYADVDLTGKIAVVFVGDPPVEDGRFNGDAMTYYGRWSYKYERALAAGAAGCLVIHEDGPASYGWNVVENSWSRERFHVLESSGDLPAALAIQGWISRDTAEALAKANGSTLNAWHEGAVRAGFRPLALASRLEGSLATAERRISDVNVIGRIPSATGLQESVVVTAHWDHLGTRTIEGADPSQDTIFNGAVDNASGTAGLLGIAAELEHRTRGKRPKRSILFIATTAEEQGLLGSEYFAANPAVPIASIVAAVNLDSMNVHGRTRTIQVVGSGQSTLEDELAEIAARQGRTIVPDERPEAGAYYRSDHFPLAKAGVPAIYFRGGNDMEDGGPEAGQKLADARAEHYHTVDDEFDASWPFTGALQDAQTVAELVLEVAELEAKPSWKATSEFAKLR